VDAVSPGNQNTAATFVSRAIAAMPVSRKSGPTANATAPELRKMNAISSALSMKLTGTSTAPIRASANRTAAKAWELRDSTATRSPGRIPMSQSPLASRSQTLSNSR
jgi:hypothetical protein